jgi:phospholipid/cholesterol/gamma-HCH transport system substrate-binding protein
MADRALRLRLGVFMGLTLVGLAGLVVLFGGSPQLFSSDAKYTILFPEAPGIGPGTPIRKSGVRIGQVTALELDPESGQVRVLIAVNRKYLPRHSEEAHITRGLLSGDTAVDFLPKLGLDGQPVPRSEEWKPGEEIPGVPPLTPRSVINQASLAQAQESLNKITRTFERFEQVAPKLESTADEATGLFKDVRAFIPELKKTNQKIQNLLGPDTPAAPVPPMAGPVMPIGFLTQPPVAEPNLKDLIRDAQESLRTVKTLADEVRATMKRLEPELNATAKGARQTFDNINEVLSPENRKQVAELLKNLNSVSGSIIKFATSLGGVLDAAEKAIRNIDTQVTQVGLVVGDVRAVTRPLAARSENLVKSVADSADELSKVLSEIRVVVNTFARENGTIQKLITEPTVYQNLDAASGSLARILARSEKITRDLEVFADKVARRPELIGLGGALRPSAGLKEAPGAPSYHADWPPASTARPPAGPNWLPPPQEGTLPPIQGYKP